MQGIRQRSAPEVLRDIGPDGPVLFPKALKARGVQERDQFIKKRRFRPDNDFDERSRHLLRPQAVHDLRDDGPYRLETFRAAVLRDILVRVPEAIRLIGVVEVDDVDRPDPCFIERDVVVEDLLPLLVRKLTDAEGCGGVPHESDDIRRVDSWYPVPNDIFGSMVRTMSPGSG